MHKKFEIKWTKIKGGCHSGRKVVTNNSKSDLPLIDRKILKYQFVARNATSEFAIFFLCNYDINSSKMGICAHFLLLTFLMSVDRQAHHQD